jgi:branched-chain amino acid aminotransferase
MVRLQKPKFVYMGGRLRRWDDAVLHVGCEAVTRGLNVFEGIKGYWRSDARFGIVMLRRHYERLRRSARLLHIPFDTPYEQYEGAIYELASSLLEPDRDMWLRTTLYVTEGHWGEGTVADLVVTAYQSEKHAPEPVNLGVSTWRRSTDLALPARVKTGTNYQVARLARIEGRAHGYDDMALLNQEGRVAEATGACILMVREGTVYTPPPTEGALESITLEVVEALARSLGVNFVRRPIDRTELLVADELALCGTLAEVALVRSIDGLQLPSKSVVLQALQTRYFDAVRGVDPHPSVVFSIVPFSQASGSAGPPPGDVNRVATTEVSK